MRRFYQALSVIAVAGALSVAAHGQFEMQDSTTTADLRGIVSVGNGTAWASGTHGTVLRTEDSGFVWQGCATPPGAEQLDFRGIQAFDDLTAIVMSSGKGNLSRVYRTTDGCLTWKLVFTNPDADGFFDAIAVSPPGPQTVKDYGVLIGDPVNGAFSLFLTFDRGSTWKRMVGAPKAKPGEALFAASNQALMFSRGTTDFVFVTGGLSGSRLLRFAECGDSPTKGCEERWSREAVGLTSPNPPATGSPLEKGWEEFALHFPAIESGGAFAVATARTSRGGAQEVVVGGDYAKPAQSNGTANWWHLRIRETPWTRSESMPHGYRSSVAYDSQSKRWITVGPNGTDVSSDDGRNWRALRPGKIDVTDADRNWNALSLPFVVGPHGRIGRLRDGVLSAAAEK